MVWVLPTTSWGAAAVLAEAALPPEGERCRPFVSSTMPPTATAARTTSATTTRASTVRPDRRDGSPVDGAAGGGPTGWPPHCPGSTAVRGGPGGGAGVGPVPPPNSPPRPPVSAARAPGSDQLPTGHGAATGAGTAAKG